MTALADHQTDLADFIVDFNTTMGTTAAHAADLRTSVDELGPTARHAAEGFTELNAALPATRQFARNLTASLPELPATIAAAKPWLAQAQAALSDEEVGGLLDRLQPATKNLAALGHAQRAWLPRIDAFNRCVTNVLIPTGKLKVDDGALSANTENYKEFWYALVGMAGEGQFFDGNGGYLRLQAAHGPTQIVTGKTNYSNFPFIGAPTLPPLSTRPAYGNKLPPFVRSVPCASSPVPDVNNAVVDRPARRCEPERPGARRQGRRRRRRRLMRGVRKQLRNAIWLGVMVAVGLLVGGYLLAHQRVNWPTWTPGLGKEYFTLNAEFTNSAGVLPGQGNAVTIAGVKVGEITGEEVKNGRAVLKLRIDEKYGHVHPDATLLLRPKTALKDMVAELDPGRRGNLLHNGDTLAGQLDQPRRQLRRDPGRPRRRHARGARGAAAGRGHGARRRRRA